MNEYTNHIKIKKSSERAFGFIFFLFFLILALFPLIFDKPIKIWLIIFSLVILFITYFFPKILIYPNKIWLKIGEIIGFFTSPIIMLFVYLITILPIGLIIKIFNNDLINQNYDKKINSYWIKRSNEMESLKKQF
tara:strand:+ start:243 stop:647 length:405 start_codon:yes stop_codon:yes gene_type:complete